MRPPTNPLDPDPLHVDPVDLYVVQELEGQERPSWLALVGCGSAILVAIAIAMLAVIWLAPIVRGAEPPAIGTVMEGGKLSYADPSFGPDYLAVRYDRGTLVRVCAETCQTLVSTDYGPSRKIRPHRIADLAFGRWLEVCGYTAEEGRIRGLCDATIEILEVPEAPRTDVAGTVYFEERSNPILVFLASIAVVTAGFLRLTRTTRG